MMHFCSLYSGSSGNALFVSVNNTKILVDAGLSCKKVVEAISSIGEDPNKLNAIIISHEHSDHIRGAGIIARKLNIPIYANENTWCRMLPFLGKVAPENIRTFETGKRFIIGDVEINPFPIPHDAAEPVAFSFYALDRKLTIATDIGHINDEILLQIDGSDLILLESNHDTDMLQVGPYPYHLKKRIAGQHGHLSNENAAKLVTYLAERGTSHFILGHLSAENNFPELAYITTENMLKEKNFIIGKDILLEIARRDGVGALISV